MNGGGAIVNVASVNAVVPGLQQGIYSITKAAVVGLTKAFARECAPPGVRVNALLPGLTRTRLAGALLYLVSGASSYTTGAALNVDGGFLVT